jgi:tripartite-type tricarboxylate transporter receptor subunit TctC
MYDLDVVVDNIIGGNGTVALSQILLDRTGTVVGNFQSSTFNSMTLGDFPRTIEDFTWISTLLGESHCVMVVRDSPIRTPEDFFNAVRRGRPGDFPVGIAGTINGGEAAMMEFGNILGVQDVLVPVTFPGASRVVAEMLGGNLPIGVIKINDAVSQVVSGEIRPLFSISKGRLTGQPNLPAVTEFELWGNRVPYADPDFMTAYLIGPGNMREDVRAYLAEVWKGALSSAVFADIIKDWAVRATPVLTGAEVLAAARANQAAFADMLNQFYR